MQTPTSLVGDVGDQQVLPDREPQRAAAEALADLGEPAHLLGGDAADRQHDAEIVEARLLLPVHADMAVLVGDRPRRERDPGGTAQRRPVFLLDLLQEFGATHAVEHVLQPRLGAVGAVAVGDEGAHHGAGDLHALVGLQQHAGLVGEVAMAGDAAELQAEIDAIAGAFLGACAATKPMSLVSSSTGTLPPPSKAMLNLRGRPYISR